MGGFDGNGTYVRYYNWTQDAANAIPILASRFDTEHNGFAAALSNCLTRDGQGKPSADISWNNYKLTNLADAAAAHDAVSQSYGDSRYARYGDTTANFTGSLQSGGIGVLSGYSVRKSSNTPRSSTTTLADDPELVIAIGSGFYSFKIQLFIAAASTTIAGFKWSGAFSAALSDAGYAMQTTQLNSSTGLIGPTASFVGSSWTTANIKVGTPPDTILAQGYFSVASPGTFSIQWAQNSSVASNTSVLAGSHVLLQRVA